MERLQFPITKKEADKHGTQYSSQANKQALFPSRLRELREEKGISQAMLASVLGVSKSTIGLWETGDTLPDAKSLCDLASYYGVSTDYITGRTEVESFDIELIPVCNILGLSEQAGRLLISTKNNPFVHEVLNRILSDGRFVLLGFSASDVMRKQSKADSVLQEFIDKYAEIEPSLKNTVNISDLLQWAFEYGDNHPDSAVVYDRDVLVRVQNDLDYEKYKTNRIFSQILDEVTTNG